MKKRKGFLLIDAIFAFMILTLILVLLHGSMIRLLKSYSNVQIRYLERVREWENI